VERAVDEGSGRVEIVVLLLLHRNPSAHFFFWGNLRWFGKLVRRLVGE
jgi:hypothetical protein